MTEKEFLISRALGVFNPQYGRNIKVEDCEIISISPDPMSDRGYEITTPDEKDSEFFRIRLYVKFDRMDRSIPARLDVSMPYINGALGDEVYVILTYVSEMWREEYRFDPLDPNELPFGVILQEDGAPILQENGKFTLVE